jgi:hypothetical protein
MATACYPNNHVFATQKYRSNDITTKKFMPCYLCRRSIPFNCCQYESKMMLKVVNTTGPKPDHEFFCLSAREAQQAMKSLVSLFETKLTEEKDAKWKTRSLDLVNWYLSFDFSSMGCYERHEELLKAIAEKKRIEKERLNYRKTHDVVCEEDYPEHLRLTNVSCVSESEDEVEDETDEYTD